MAGSPAWVEACLRLEGLSWGDGYDACSLASPLVTSEGRTPEHYAHRLLPCSPILRVRAHLHGISHARREYFAAVLRLKWLRWWAHPRVKYWKGYPWTDWNQSFQIWDGPSFYCNKCRPVGSWHRCNICEREKARWRRAVALATDLTRASKHLGKSIRFVTLTLPNVEDIETGIADIKRKVKNLRRSKEFSGKVVGGADFYEWTEAADGSFNVHHHGLWIGSYWKQAELTKAWGHGHTWISSIRRGKKGTKRMVAYGVKYATKQADAGIRSRARFGCLYGTAFAELESAQKSAEESSIAVDALD